MFGVSRYAAVHEPVVPDAQLALWKSSIDIAYDPCKCKVKKLPPVLPKPPPPPNVYQKLFRLARLGMKKPLTELKDEHMIAFTIITRELSS